MGRQWKKKTKIVLQVKVIKTRGDKRRTAQKEIIKRHSQQKRRSRRKVM